VAAEKEIADAEAAAARNDQVRTLEGVALLTVCYSSLTNQRNQVKKCQMLFIIYQTASCFL
jgi:hypothetical protein